MANGLRIDIRADFGKVQRSLDQLRSDMRSTVIARTLNRLGDSTKTQATREISAAYNLTSGKVRQRIQVRRAFANRSLSVSIEVPSRNGARATNLITFGAKSLKAGGVSVKIRRDRPPLRGKQWFILTNKRTGGTFVAKRVGTKRADIEPVRTVDVGQMFNSKAVNATLLRTIRERFPREFEAQTRFALQRFKR